MMREKEAMTGLGHNFRAITGAVLASFLLVSTIWLPWATYRSNTLDMAFKSGRFGLVLLVCGAGSLGLVATSLLWRKVSAPWLQVFLGCAALLSSVAIALSKIADANQTANTGKGYSVTSYGIGAGLAIAASVAMVVSSVTLLKSNKVSASHGEGPSSVGADRLL
jgi:hypothetical protein